MSQENILEKNLKIHAAPCRQILVNLRTDPQKGLSSREATDRLKTVGKNELTRIPKARWYVIFFRQFTNVLIVILLAAAIISIVAGELTDALTIFIVSVEG